MKPISPAIILIISSCLTFNVGNAFAGDMKDIFDYYAKGSPGTFDTDSMRHWTGASFSGRNALNEPNLFQMPTISMGGSCKGIDFHASGFGLVTKDEIVQMARGIAQGAPGYFFNMAIGAVCSSCLQNINEFMRKLEQFNQLTKGSCERFWDKVTSSGTSDKEKVNAQAEAAGGLLDNLTGHLNSWGDKLDQAYLAVAPGRSLGNNTLASTQAVLNENVVYERIKASFTSRYTLAAGAGGLSTPELAMSLFGTLIITAKEDATEEVNMLPYNPAANLSPYNLMFGSPNPISFYKCDAPVTDDATECLSITSVEDASLTGLYDKFRVQLIGEDGNGGIIGKIRRRENLTVEELEFVKAFRLPYVKIATDLKGRMVEDMGKRFAYMLASEHINKLYNETSYTLRLALRKEHTKNTVDFRENINGYLDDAVISLEQMNEQVETKLNEIDKTIQTLNAANQLARITGNGVH
jgi:conjugative transfer pilus assembly protein TraH